MSNETQAGDPKTGPSPKNARPDRTKSGIYGLLAAIIAILATGAGIWFGLGSFDSPSPPARPVTLTAGTFLPNPRALEPFELVDQDSKPLTQDTLKGRWTFIAIGYTHCPDVCPTTLATFDAIDRALTDGDRHPADFLFISIDPERDPPERLAQYVRYFNPSFFGATGTDEALQGLTKQLGILYARVDDQDSAMGYLMDHSASILLFNPEVRLAALFSPPHDPAKMAADFRTILKHY